MPRFFYDYLAVKVYGCLSLICIYHLFVKVYGCLSLILAKTNYDEICTSFLVTAYSKKCRENERIHLFKILEKRLYAQHFIPLQYFRTLSDLCFITCLDFLMIIWL